MTTGSGVGAGLDTLGGLTLARVADLVTTVSATGQRAAAEFATGDSLHQASNVPPLLPPAVAPLVSKVCTGWAVCVAVTGVMYGVTTGMFSPAGLRTVRGPGPAWYWRVDDCGPTVTG